MSGAYAAFQFNRSIEASKDRKIIIEGLRHNIFIVAVKLRQLRTIKERMLDPFENVELRWAQMRDFKKIDEKEKIDFSTLRFTQEEYPQFLMDLNVAEDDYRLSIRTMNERSKMYKEIIYPVQYKVANDPETPDTYDEMNKHIDTASRLHLSGETDTCYSIIPRTIQLFEELHDVLLTIARKRFPEVSFLEHDENVRK